MLSIALSSHLFRENGTIFNIDVWWTPPFCSLLRYRCLNCRKPPEKFPVFPFANRSLSIIIVNLHDAGLFEIAKTSLNLSIINRYRARSESGTVILINASNWTLSEHVLSGRPHSWALVEIGRSIGAAWPRRTWARWNNGCWSSLQWVGRYST